VSIAFIKGHGTENDFVLLDDPDGELDLTAALVRRLADRRAGVGADGVIRVVRTAAALPEYRDGLPMLPMVHGLLERGRQRRRDVWQRRPGVHHAPDPRGWIDLPDGGEQVIATRAGAKTVRRRGDLISADLGPWHVVGGPAAVTAGGDVKVSLPGLPVLPGLSVELGNPHVVVVIPDVETLAAIDLSVPPVVDPVPAHGTNVELVVPMHDQQVLGELGHLRMRVHERGSARPAPAVPARGAALAARAFGPGAPDHWRIDVPVEPAGHAQGRRPMATSRLSGRPVIVGRGTSSTPEP
jgi:diaminopimelate epimerase